MARIVVVGSLNMDLVAAAPRLPREGETLMGTQFYDTPGGKGANQAYAVAKLGGEVAMSGRVGTDDYGKRLRANLAAVGCDVNGVRTIEGASGLAVIIVTETGKNSIVVIPGANACFGPADLLADGEHLAGAQFVMLQLETPLDTVIAAARSAKQNGSQVILDPAPALPVLPPDLLSHVDILTPNESEASRLVGRSSVELTMDEATVIARQLQASGVKTVIMKLGAQGCVLVDGDSVARIPAPAVRAVDTTAAGDVFNAALVVARSEGASLVAACEFAVRAAALSVMRVGAQQSMPSRSEFEAFHWGEVTE